MRNSSYLKGFTILFLLAGALAIGYGVSAQGGHADVEFPIPELGNCTSEQNCIAYCNEPDHFEGCLVFALENDIISAQEAEIARNAGRFDDIGPGGCNGQQECEAYCEDIANINECLAFAEEYGLMSPQELIEAQGVARALSQGVQFPGGCQSRTQCEAYCENPDHMRECVEFGAQSGLIPPGELEEARMVLRALESGVQLPGGCRDRDECDIYCENPANIDECFEFAVAAGFIPPDEIEEARKMMPLMREGRMPGGCRDRDECEAYCENNFAECADVFVEIGVISPEEAEIFRKTGGKGPGDCSGQQECEDFCNNPANQEACFAFASEHGLIPEGELQSLEEGIGRFQSGFNDAPPEVKTCLNDAIGADTIRKIVAGELLPNPEIGGHMRRCFEQFGSKGPGGCETEEECVAYCSDPAHFDECGGGSRIDRENFDGDVPPDFRLEGEFREEFQGEFEQEFQRQYEQQFQQQYQDQYQQFIPDELKEAIERGELPFEQFQIPGDIPEGFIPPEFQQYEQFIPSEGFDQEFIPPDSPDAFVAPPVEEYDPPPTEESSPPPSDGTGFILNAFQAFLNLLGL